MNVTRIKEAVRDRDGHRCTVCGMTSDEHVERFGKLLSVHRVIPGSEYTVGGCRSYCRPCHEEEHRRLSAMGVKTIGQRERVRRPAKPTRAVSVMLDAESDAHLGLIAEYYHTSKTSALKIAIVETAGRLEFEEY